MTGGADDPPPHGAAIARAGSAAGSWAFARAWAKAISGTSYVPSTYAEVEGYLYDLTRRLAEALVADPFRLHAAYDVGSELVRAHFSSAEALGRTVEVIDLRLLSDLAVVVPDAQDRMGRLLGALTTGHARALRDRTLSEQESIRRAAMVARAHAEQALRASEARFRYQATHDPLTGLPNRARLAERLRALLPTPGHQRLGLCLLDLDGFKVINDSFGHDVGDQLLAAVAARLDERLTGAKYLVARMGGDEFVILVEDSRAADEVVELAERAIAAVAEPLVLEGRELSVSASVGIVERRMAGASAVEVMRAADIALHWAKAAGRNRWEMYDPHRGDREVARHSLAAAMPAALEHGEFFLDFQPLVSLEDKQLVGAEALVRWRHPQLGVIGPDRFISLAEENGLIVRLGAEILSQACRQASQWESDRCGAGFVSVNLAVQQIRDPGLIDTVVGTLERTGLPAGRLQLEITESAVMDTDDEPVTVLHKLARMGVRLAIDDFGTGYSNLAYLRSLPAHQMKIAGSFVAGLRSSTAVSHTDEQILATLVSLGHTLGLAVTAEGVETSAQADRLRAIGCDIGQGWFFGRPGPPEAIARQLATPDR